MRCECGFKFSGPGEFRNCEAFITKDGHGGVICPTCDNAYLNGRKVILKERLKMVNRSFSVLLCGQGKRQKVTF